MCTSFIKKTRDNHLIGMNFDNNGMKYSISTIKKDWFIIYVNTGKIKTPSFGIHKSGVFFNDLCVGSNGKGDYKRSSGVTHTAKFLLGIIDGKLDVGNLGEFLNHTEIVNVPDWSTHNMICTEQGNVWIIEPGRGNRYRELGKGEFQIMTNESILESKDDYNISCNRFRKVSEVLEKDEVFNVTKAFELLDNVKQNDGEWITDLSLVFDKNMGIVYYAENQNYVDINEFSFK